jgi:hypothetical protein
MRRKYKCKYCNKMIVVEGGMCWDCKEKLEDVKTLLRMVKTAARKKECNRDKL